MFALLLLVLPPLTEGSSSACRHHVGCVLPPASTEQLVYPTAPSTWYQQFVYRVPGVYDLGCLTYFQYPSEKPNVINFKGNFSRVPKFPIEGFSIVNGNRLNAVYYGVWDCYLSGPLNVVFTHQDFVIGLSCLLGYEFAAIHTAVKEPNEELKELIWKVVNNHTELDERKFTKAVC